MITDFFHRTWHNNTVSDWAISLGIFVGVALLSKGVYKLFCYLITKITARTKTQLDDLVVKKLQLPIMAFIILIGIRFSLQRLTFSEQIDAIIRKAFIVAIILNVTWILIQLVRALLEIYIGRNTARSKQVISFIERLSTVILGGIGLVVALNNAGFDVAALIAGLGIGGVALALAAQDTVKNLFGGVVVFVERPFRVGDHIKVRDIEGIVDEIRMRSTRLKNSGGQLILVPNAIFSDSPVINIINEPPNKINIPVSLSPKNSADKIDRAFQLIHEIAKKNNHGKNGDGAKVYFEKVNGSSFEIRLDITPADGANSLELQTEMMKEIIQNFKANEIEFA